MTGSFQQVLRNDNGDTFKIAAWKISHFSAISFWFITNKLVSLSTIHDNCIQKQERCWIFIEKTSLDCATVFINCDYKIVKNIYINNERSCCEDYELKYKKCPQDYRLTAYLLRQANNLKFKLHEVKM